MEDDESFWLHNRPPVSSLTFGDTIKTNNFGGLDATRVLQAQRAQAVLDFMNAIQRKNENYARMLLDDGLVNVNVDQGLPLQTAIRQNDASMTHMLVAGYNARVDDTHLELAVQVGNTDIFNLLIQSHAPSHPQTCKTLVLKALVNGNLEIVNSLLATPSCSSVLKTITAKEYTRLVKTIYSYGKTHSANLTQICRFLNQHGTMLSKEALYKCMKWAVEHCSLEMLEYLDELHFHPNEGNYRPRKLLAKSLMNNCNKQMLDYLLTKTEQSNTTFEDDFQTLLGAVKSGNMDLLRYFMNQQQESLDDTNKRRIISIAIVWNQTNVLQVLFDEYDFSPAMIRDDSIDIKIGSKWEIILFLYRRNDARYLKYSTHIRALREAISQKKTELVGLIFPHVISQLLQKKKDYDCLILIAAIHADPQIMEMVLRDYTPMEPRVILLALNAATTTIMVDFLMHYPLPSTGRPITLSEEEIMNLVKNALERARQNVAEYFLPPHSLAEFMLNTPALVDKIASMAPEYKGRQVHLHKKAYLYKQPNDTDSESVRFFYVGSDLYSFNRNYIWKIQIEEKLPPAVALVPHRFQTFQDPVVKEYAIPDYAADDDEMVDEDDDYYNNTVLYQTSRVLTSRAFGQNVVFLDVVGIGTRHMACLLEPLSGPSTRARVVLIPLLSPDKLDLQHATVIHAFPSNMNLELATLVCVGEWLAFTNNPAIVALPLTRKGQVVYKRVEFNPFAVVDLAAHNSGNTQACISSNLPDVERYLDNHPNLEPEASYLEGYPNSFSEEISDSDFSTYLIPLPRGTVTESDKFNFEIASPYTRSIITNPYRIPSRITIKDYQDRKRRAVNIAHALVTPIKRPSDKVLRSTFTILPSSASVFGRVYCVVKIKTQKPLFRKLVFCRYTDNMEELYEAHAHYILAERALGHMRNTRIADMYAKSNSETRLQKEKNNARNAKLLGPSVVLKNSLLPGPQTRLLRNMLHALSPEEKDAAFQSWTKKIRRVYHGKEYFLDRRPWMLSREHLCLAALNQDPDWQHEETHDLDCEPEETDYDVDDYYETFEYEEDDDEDNEPAVLAGEEEFLGEDEEDDHSEEEDEEEEEDDDE